ncbi:hypothetical protein SBV1_3580010 [Verrucomicrobia bacterium]|nr:hypothetical protein SBV1_3580010 [Verrucomicrobiota bacterium]
MCYELNITVEVESDHAPDRVAKQMESLFEFGTIKESIADGLQLLDDPHLLAVAVKTKGNGDSGRV